MIEFTRLVTEGFCSISQADIALNQNQIVWIRGANGEGKAQPLNEPVLTPNGWVEIGKLKVGDEVMNPITGLPIRIIKVTDRGYLPTYKISFSDKSHTYCADDHLWSVYKSGKTRYRLRVMDTKSLLEDYKYENKSKPGTYCYRYSVPLTKPIQYTSKSLPIHPYVLGFILGDGCISGNRPIVRISTNEKDWEEVVDRLKSYLPDPKMVHIGTCIRGTVRHFRIHGLGKELKELGLLGKKSSNKFIPEIYLRSSIEDRKYLLAGLLDTDAHSGSPKKRSKVSSYTSKSRKLRDGVVELVRSLGGISTKNHQRRYKYGRYTTSYECSIRLDYIPFLRKYKYDQFGDFYRRNRMVNTIRKIEYIGKINSRCITVDSPDGLYITRNYIVTHNSSLISSLVWCIYGKNLKGKSQVNTWEELRPKDYKGTKVCIYFLKDGVPYNIIRCQKYTSEIEDGAKGKDRVLLIRDGELLDLKGKFSIQQEINKVLGLPYELFINSIVFGQGLKRLIEEDNSNKRAIFEEIFNLNFLNTAKDIAKGKKDAMREGILDMEGDLNVMTDKLENYKELKRKLKTQELEAKINRSKQITELESTRLDYAKKLGNIQRSKSEEVLQTLPIRIKNTNELISKYKTTKDLCEETIDIPLEEFIDDIYKLVKNKRYSEALSSLKKLKKAYKGISDCDKELSQLYDRKSKLMDIKSNYDKLEMKATWYSRKMVEIDDEIRKLEEAKYDTFSEDYEGKISHLRKKIKPLKAKYESQLSEYRDYQWLLDDPLGNQGIKAFLFDSSIDLINEILNKYVPILGFKIEFGVNLDSARKDFVTTIERDDIIMEYDELSGGEKQLVNISLALAMNELLTVSQGFNIAFMDEVFESLSSENIELVTSLIREIFKDKTLFLITHQNTIPLGNVKILQVEKVKGLSSYKVL